MTRLTDVERLHRAVSEAEVLDAERLVRGRVSAP